MPAENHPFLSQRPRHLRHGDRHSAGGHRAEKATVIFERGKQFGFERLIGGVHYPSDVEAGRITGSVLAAELLRNAAFQADLARAAVEVRTALGLPPLQPAPSLPPQARRRQTRRRPGHAPARRRRAGQVRRD